MKEIYSPITKISLEGYEVSNLGNVRNSKRGNVLKQTVRSGGYLAANIRGSAPHTHVLVCTAYHGEKPGNDYEVDHIDGNRFNNHADNLQWITKKENIAKKSKSVKPKLKKLTYVEWREIIDLFMSGNYSKNAIAKHVGRDRTSIISVLHGKTFSKWFNCLSDVEINKIDSSHKKWGH
ncbi:HNH endonuclease signature motif containing protein [Kosakonia radicincitans]|uniref:HNH endonuclease signature motif containing protein n=1 Tax=Kosakonia radicincitans TaxID=283686 RepID=UPI002368E9AA|nr:HNH endonuclease signature motif containing protein [Kosakonia radicincitans]MDD7993786.1 HNH endonuclease signature motif containing protein [Kosakonia radicincitans]